MKIGRFIPLIIAAAALGLGAFALLRGKPEQADAMIGQIPAPISLAILTGDTPAAAAALAVKGPAIVNFWASWCTPCRAEHPFVTDLAQKAGIPFVGVAYRDTPAAAAAYLKELGNPYKEIRLDPEGQAGFNFGIKGVPETFVIGRDGAILARISGPLTPDSIETAIVPALERAKTTPSR